VAGAVVEALWWGRRSGGGGKGRGGRGVRWWWWKGRAKLEVGDDPDMWGPPTRERERRERESWACWARNFFYFNNLFFIKN